MPKSIITKSFEFHEVKIGAEGNGTFAGYVSTFGNVDSVGDEVVKGAFKDDLERFQKDGFIALNHDWAGIPIATISKAQEDERGLYIEGEFHSTAKAQEVRTTMQERLDRGSTVKFSIGFSIIEQEAGKKEGYNRKVRFLKKIKLYEASFVNVPANTEADATSVKSLYTVLQEAKSGFSNGIGRSIALSVLETLQWRLWSAVYDEIDSRRDTLPDSLPMLFDEFKNIAVSSILMAMQADAEMAAKSIKDIADVAKELMQSRSASEDAGGGGTESKEQQDDNTVEGADNEEKPANPTAPLEQLIEATTSEAKSIRTEAEAELKAGRTLSQQNYDRIQAHAGKLDETATALTEAAADMRGLLEDASPSMELVKSLEELTREINRTEYEIATTILTTTEE